VSRAVVDRNTRRRWRYLTEDLARSKASKFSINNRATLAPGTSEHQVLALLCKPPHPMFRRSPNWAASDLSGP
jgi:hypothetical protein